MFKNGWMFSGKHMPRSCFYGSSVQVAVFTSQPLSALRQKFPLSIDRLCIYDLGQLVERRGAAMFQPVPLPK